MKSKKIAAVLAACALTFCAGGCNVNGNTGTGGGAGTNIGNTAGQSAVSSLPEVVSPPPEQSRPLTGNSEYAFSDENVDIRLDTGRAEHTVDEVIEIKVTVTNNAKTPVVYVRGSGSNRVPESLKVTLGKLTPLYHPFMTTMDYRIDELAPGESVTFDCPVAPYIAVDTADEPVGLDKDIEYFKGNESFTAAVTGEVSGELSFTYAVSPTDDVADGIELVQSEQQKTLTGTFVVGII